MVSADYTWDAVEQFQWCFAEVNAGIVCACAPALKPFFARYIPSLLTSRFHSNDRDSDETKSNELAPPGSSIRYHIKDAYELQLRDDVSVETAMTKHSGVDDETRLWQDATNPGRKTVTTCSVAHAC